MALDSGNVRLASTGKVSLAAFGTPLPGTATASLNAAFTDVGYLDDTGVVISPAVNTQGIKAWQAAVDVKTVLTDVQLELKFVMIEITQVSTANYFFGGAWANYFGQGKYTFASNPSLTELSLVVDWTGDDASSNRMVVNRGIITARQDMSLQRTVNQALGITFHVLDNNGTLATYYSTNPDLIPGT